MSGFDKERAVPRVDCLVVLLHEAPEVFLARTTPSLRGIHTRICSTQSVALHGDMNAIEALLAAEARAVHHYSYPAIDAPDKTRVPSQRTTTTANKKQLVQIGVAFFVLIAMAMLLRVHLAARRQPAGSET